MVRLGQGHTPNWERLTLLGCGGSREQIFATLTAVGIDKITKKGPLQWGFNAWTFFFFFYPDTIFLFFKTE
jgi:hypothetical protein